MRVSVSSISAASQVLPASGSCSHATSPQMASKPKPRHTSTLLGFCAENASWERTRLQAGPFNVKLLPIFFCQGVNLEVSHSLL
eukprot:s2205_g17.t1